MMYASNVTELRALVGDGERLAILSGYNNADDCGGGVFYWESADAPDNSGTIFNQNAGESSGWRGIYSGALNIRWFGGGSDSSSIDQRPIIQHAIDVAVEPSYY